MHTTQHEHSAARTSPHAAPTTYYPAPLPHTHTLFPHPPTDPHTLPHPPSHPHIPSTHHTHLTSLPPHQSRERQQPTLNAPLSFPRLAPPATTQTGPPSRWGVGSLDTHSRQRSPSSDAVAWGAQSWGLGGRDTASGEGERAPTPPATRQRRTFTTPDPHTILWTTQFRLCEPAVALRTILAHTVRAPCSGRPRPNPPPTHRPHTTLLHYPSHHHHTHSLRSQPKPNHLLLTQQPLADLRENALHKDIAEGHKRRAARAVV